MRSTTLLVAAIVIATMFVVPAAAVMIAPTNVKYFHTSLPPGPVTDPIGAELHELYPDYCNWYNLTSWYDNNNDGNLSYCDVIDITNRTTDEVTWWHVEEVTVTIWVTNVSLEREMYLEYMLMADGISIEEMLKSPVGTYWHEIYPVFCNVYELTSWEDNGDGNLSYCDTIDITNEETGEVTWWHVEEVAIDIVVRTMCLGECYSEDECEGEMLGIMPCWQCLPNRGESWKNLPCPMCPCDCKIRCWNETCPQCCDGIDNDGDGGTDCDGLGNMANRDKECQCCTDLNESVKDPCGQGSAEPCIPEAATFAMVGIGILGIIGIGLRRREL